MSLILLISGVLLAISSVLIFFRLGAISLIVFLPVAFMPVFFSSYSDSLSLFLVPLIFGTAGGYCLRLSRGLDIYLTASAIVFALLFTGGYYLIKNIHEYDMVKAGGQNLIEQMEKTKPELDKIFLEYNTPEENRERIKGDFQKTLELLQDRKWIQFVRDMLPFITFIYSLLIGSLSFFFLKKFFLKKDGDRMKALEFFKINDYAIFAFIGSWALFLILDSTVYPVPSIVSLNLALMLSVLYAVQAIGIAKFFLIRKGMPVFVLPILIISVMLLGASAFMFTATILTGIGTLDLWADFRKLNPETK